MVCKIEGIRAAKQKPCMSRNTRTSQRLETQINAKIVMPQIKDAQTKLLKESPLSSFLFPQ